MGRRELKKQSNSQVKSATAATDAENAGGKWEVGRCGDSEAGDWVAVK